MATGLELPSPKYLKLHVAVCRIAHMSGAAGYLDLYDQEVEAIQVMACHGSSADLSLDSQLSQALLVDKLVSSVKFSIVTPN